MATHADRIAQDTVRLTTTNGAQVVIVGMDSLSVSVTIPGYLFKSRDLRDVAETLSQLAAAIDKRNQ